MNTNQHTHVLLFEFFYRYMFTIRQISEAVQNAVKRGVEVRIIVDRSMISTSGSQVDKIQEKGKFNV